MRYSIEMRKLRGKILYEIAVWGSSFTQITVIEFVYKLVHALLFKYCVWLLTYTER